MPTPRVWLGMDGSEVRCRVSPPGMNVLTSGVTRNYIDERSGHLRIDAGSLSTPNNPGSYTYFFSRDFGEPPIFDFIIQVFVTGGIMQMDWGESAVEYNFNSGNFINTARFMRDFVIDVYRDRFVVNKDFGFYNIRWRAMI